MRSSTVDGEVQRVLTAALKSNIMYISHYSVLAGNHGERRVYDSMRR